MRTRCVAAPRALALLRCRQEAVDCVVTHNNDLCVRTCALGHIFATWTASLIPFDGEDEELHEELDEELDDEELYDSEDEDGWGM